MKKYHVRAIVCKNHTDSKVIFTYFTHFPKYQYWLYEDLNCLEILMPLYATHPCSEFKIKRSYFSKYIKDINLISGEFEHIPRKAWWKYMIHLKILLCNISIFVNICGQMLRTLCPFLKVCWNPFWRLVMANYYFYLSKAK